MYSSFQTHTGMTGYIVLIIGAFIFGVSMFFPEQIVRLVHADLAKHIVEYDVWYRCLGSLWLSLSFTSILALRDPLRYKSIWILPYFPRALQGMSFKDRAIHQWTSDMVKEWIVSLPETENFTAGVKQKLIAAMDAYRAKNNSSVTGEDIDDADVDDIQTLFPGIEKPDAKKLAKRVQSYKQRVVDDHFGNGNHEGQPAGVFERGAAHKTVFHFNFLWYKQSVVDVHIGKGNHEGQPGAAHEPAEFHLNLFGALSRCVVIKQVRSSLTVADLKKLYLIEQGREIEANKYAAAKWAPGKSEKEKVTLYYNGTPLQNDKLLSYYGIDSPLCQVHVTYRVNGGSDDSCCNGGKACTTAVIQKFT